MRRAVLNVPLRMLFLWAVVGACCDSNRSGAVPQPIVREIEGLANARAVGDDLLFGGQPTPAALAALAAKGYRTVLSTRAEGELPWDEAALVDSLGMRFVSIPMASPVEAITDRMVDQFDALMREAERPLLLHCGSGNRVAGLWAVWLAEREGVEPTQALGLGEKAGMTRIRPIVEKRLGTSGNER